MRAKKLSGAFGWWQPWLLVIMACARAPSCFNNARDLSHHLHDALDEAMEPSAAV